MLTIGIAVVVAAYGATAILVGARYWRTLSRREIAEAVERAQVQLPPLVAVLAPVVAATTRPVWAAVHGLLWPYVLLRVRRGGRGV